VRLTDITVPSTAVATNAREVVEHYAPPALVNHCARSYLFAAARGEALGLSIDHELLYVAAMLHDLTLEPEFDNATLPFEHAGAHVAWVFGAGAGWPVDRRRHAGQAIVDHMDDDTDVAVDPEGYLLARATSLDISGRDLAAWPADLVAGIVRQHPRLDLGELFMQRFADQAARKPACAAAAAVAGGIADRLRANPLEAIS
jgi:hypothetical protein